MSFHFPTCYLTWPDSLEEWVEDGDSEEVHDQREHRHHLEEEEHLGGHRQHVRRVEVVQQVLFIGQS